MDADHRDTDYFLRVRLNNDQVGRERMCLAVLALDRRYTQIIPRRPEGGPDGSRDLQAVLNGTTTVWGAVGFQNNVSDSPEDKRNTKKKFKDDVDAALADKPDLKGFVFFANTDMTPGEVEELREYAASKGVTELDLYWRERIRQQLDSPQGLALRYQYLKIPLSPAEQATFFSNYGSELQDIITKQHESVQKGVRRLEFLHHMSRPLQSLNLSVWLDRGCTVDDLEGARAFVKIFTAPESDAAFYIGGSSVTLPSDRAMLSTRVVSSLRVPPAPPKLEAVPAGTQAWTKHEYVLSFGIRFGTGTTITPEAFNKHLVSFYATANLAARTKKVTLEVNGFQLATWTDFEFHPSDFSLPWPLPTADTEGTKWKMNWRFIRHIDYDGTPPKA